MDNTLVQILVVFSPIIIFGIIFGIIDRSSKKQPLFDIEQRLNEDTAKLRNEKYSLERREIEFKHYVAEVEKEKTKAEEARKYYNRKITEIDQIAKRKLDAIPYFSKIMSDFLTKHYEESAYILEHKKHPAETEAKRIRELKKETREIVKRLKELEYKLKYLEELFPNINDFFDNDYLADGEEDFELETDENTDRVRKFLTVEEYKELSTVERNQLALDRYNERKKSKWQVGRDYEMYIGQAFESKGFSVEYTGIIENLEDLGRDLIATKERKTYIVQCKNWSKEKTIHEKHIFQLYGTVVLRSLEEPGQKNRGVFVTTTALSPKAKAVARELNIWVYQNIPLSAFPQIKCNVGRDGEKIYHLPFDQQYDKTVIDKSRGELYATSVYEAEALGFRRAKKHFLASTES
ncbi:MAG: restriction endonuclease [Clostridia bacterium]|nr:restriction endonuclease [Clostridia bacterium]